MKIAYLPLYLLISFFLGSCIDSTEQVAPESIVESNEIAKVKGWFETNKDVLEVYKTNPSYREFSKDLILPFFDKEPDWSNFSEYSFPDGRKVIEVNIKNLSGIVPVDFFEKYGGASSELVEEALLFVEHTNSEIGYSIWVARYFSYGKKSEGMTYHVIPSDWSGRIDLFTFSEVHLRSFEVEDGLIVKTLEYKTEEPSKRMATENMLMTCSGSWIDYPYYGTSSDGAVNSFNSIFVISCHNPIDLSGGSGGSNWPSHPSPFSPTGEGSGGGGTGGTWGSTGGSSGTSNDVCDNTNNFASNCIPFPIVEYKIINELTNPCAKKIFSNIKDGGLISATNVSNTEFSKAILDLLDNSSKYNFKILNSSDVSGNASTKPRQFNQNTGTYDVEISLSDSYLSKATQLSIVRTIIHESIHGYLLHEQYTNTTGDLYQGLTRYAIGRNYTNSNQIHHEFMPKFIDAIAYSLWSWDMSHGSKGQIPLSYMKDLAWGGLTSYRDNNGVIRYYESFKENFPNQSDRNRIENIIKNESDGNSLAKSKKCD